MFIKVTSSGSRRYVQLVEAYRDDKGLPKQRTVATLGRLDQLGSELESVISGLLRVTNAGGHQVSLFACLPTTTSGKFEHGVYCRAVGRARARRIVGAI